MTTSNWKPGDRVVHTARPEWGAGQVLSSQRIREDGQDAQRLVIRFDRAGTKTISTAVATLAAPDGRMAAFSAIETKPEGEAQPEYPPARLRELPESATDPFLPLARRLEETVALYRFRPSGGSLLDWAAAQSGLKDPLSAFNRHELEHGFEQFKLALDSHLKALVAQAAKAEPTALAGLGAKAPPEVREMLTRLLTRR